MTRTKSAKSSRRAAVLGSQEPTRKLVPEYSYSDGQDAVKICKIGGVNLDPWQSEIICDWLGRTAAGRWAAPTCGGSVPRQNGKSLLVQGRAEFGMIALNEQVIYTAHLQKTATETFEEMRDFFESPKIKKHVAEIKTAIGREQIILRNGARIKFLARTRNGGRGQHGDLLIFDEAQDLDESAQASFLPAISASINPQTVYVGTPPETAGDGVVFRGIRNRALDGKTSKTAWFEFSVDEIGDVKKVDRWAATNPALGRRILLSTIEGESEQMDADTFARERLGWWAPIITQVEETALDPAKWGACASLDPKPDGKTAYGVKIAPGGSMVALAGAVIPKTGKPRISLIEYQSTARGVKWLSDWLNARYKHASAVALDGRNGVQLIVDRISDTWRAKNSVKVCRTKDIIDSYSLLVDMVNSESVTWYKPQEILDDSAKSSTRRPIAGGFGFGGEYSLPIEAAALALWAVKNSKRDPNKKMRIG